MAEEVRFFLRTALYAGLISVVYWFLSYEIAGSVMLVSLFAGATFFVVVLALLLRASRSEMPSKKRSGLRGALGMMERVMGFDEPATESTRGPLEVAEEPMCQGSIWPLLVALAAALVGLGLLFGGWLWVPGAILATVAAGGWVTQLEP